MLNQQVVAEALLADQALNDVAYRAQQCLIGLDVYDNCLKSAGHALPGALVAGMDTSDIPLVWQGVKTPQELRDGIRKAKQYIILNSINLTIYLVDDYLKNIAEIYYEVKGDGWYSPEAFDLATGVKLANVKGWSNVEDMRHIAQRVRQFRKSLSITVQDYYDLTSGISMFIHAIGHLAGERVFERLKAQGINIPESLLGEGPKMTPKPSNDTPVDPEPSLTQEELDQLKQDDEDIDRFLDGGLNGE